MKPKQKVCCGNKFYFHVMNQNRKFCLWRKMENIIKLKLNFEQFLWMGSY